MEILNYILIIVVWACVSGVIANVTKTHFLWTFLLGPIGTIIALLLMIAKAVVKDNTCE